MHKIQMNSGGFNPETVKKRIACFEEFDNGHVLRSYEKMSVADSEERARKTSIKDPENVYYVSYDNIMEPGSDLYWFQGKSYDSEGAKQALSQYRKSGTSGLNSGRKSLNSSDEQVRVIGTVTLYSDFVDFKKSVSEHLLQTAVGSKAKLKFKWLGDNKVEVRAICSAEDERKVKILLENSDVTKTIAWATSGNSGRRRVLGLNSACDDLVKKSTATLKRKLKDASPEEKKAILAELNARGVYPKTSVNSPATQFVDTNGIMGIPGDTWTMKELAEYWDSEQGSDSCLDEYASFDDWVEDTISMMTPLDSSRKLNSANDPESPFYTATDAANYFLGKDFTVEQIERYLKRKGYSDEWIRKMFDLMDEYADEQEDFDMFNSSRKNINSNRKVGNNSMRKVIFRGKLNSSRKRMNSSRNPKYTAYSISDLSALEDESGYGPGELVDVVKQGEKTVGGKFLGFTNDDNMHFVFEEDGKPVAYEQSHDRWFPVNSSRRKLNSSEDDVTADDDVQDTGIDGGDTATETAELLDDALIVQNPETKAVSLFVATEDDEVLPESVDVIAEVTPVVEGAVLDSSRRLKRFTAAKLNSSKGCLNSDAEDVCPACGKPADECTCEPGTVAYDEIQLPDDSVVEVENILVVKGEDDNLGLFMPDDADDTVPEDYEVVAVATPVAEVEILDSSRRLKKATAAKKLNSSKK
jgi:hypothetical protein